jgi:phosphoribosylglycinamide formyltransferase 1
MTEKLPVVILISGRGSNMCALADRSRQGSLPIDIRAVISDRADAPGLQLARDRGIRTESLTLRDFADRAAFDVALSRTVANFEPQLVILAGYMKILHPDFVRSFHDRTLNIHPSLLPKYPGLHTHRKALAAGDKEHGATVHFVTDVLDGGPLIVQGRVPVHAADSEESLAARVHGAEHIIYPLAVEWFAQRRLVMRDGKVWLGGKELSSPVVVDVAAET